MNAPEFPIDEAARLLALQRTNLLDTPAEKRFDRITRLAASVFKVPICLISLVDSDRQWFKSKVGLDACETGRDISFCGHAILGDEIFIIPDTIKDERFADNPLVLNEPNIRFYAGCPLRFLDGSKLGTLCIIDNKPRNLDEDELDALKDLASTAERELAAVQLATLDELTNINNRRGFMMLAQHSLNLYARQGIPASLVFLDLNQFKPINDRFGHAEGDRALQTFADHMKIACRNSDLYARLGGDEFVVLFPNTSKTSAKTIMIRLKKDLDAYNQKAKRGYEISFSYGVVEYDPERHSNIDSLLSEGDALMYERKMSTKQ